MVKRRKTDKRIISDFKLVFNITHICVFLIFYSYLKKLYFKNINVSFLNCSTAFSKHFFSFWNSKSCLLPNGIKWPENGVKQYSKTKTRPKEVQSYDIKINTLGWSKCHNGEELENMCRVFANPWLVFYNPLSIILSFISIKKT